jgi:hypothetical protein
MEEITLAKDTDEPPSAGSAVSHIGKQLLEIVRRRMIWNRRLDFGLEGSGSVG